MTLLTPAELESTMRPGQRAVDLGAAPGGWSWHLANRGLRVTAIDNGPMSPQALATGMIEHLRADGFTGDMDAAVWDQVIGINLSGTFYCCRSAMAHLAASGGGSIINTASSMAHLPLGMLDAYAASKGGVAMLTRSMASGAGRVGVRVNAISPGYVDTPMNALIWQTPQLHDAFAQGHATGLQTAEEIAEVVVFLASDASRSFTGAVLTCDRGWTAFKRPEALG